MNPGEAESHDLETRPRARPGQSPPPAFVVKKLRDYEIAALHDAGVTDDEIRAIAVIGMGADEIHELIIRGRSG